MTVTKLVYYPYGSKYLLRRYKLPPNCTLSAFQAADPWTHRVFAMMISLQFVPFKKFLSIFLVCWGDPRESKLTSGVCFGPLGQNSTDFRGEEKRSENPFIWPFIGKPHSIYNYRGRGPSCLGAAFKYIFMFTPTWRRFPFWLVFFKRVETTN